MSQPDNKYIKKLIQLFLTQGLTSEEQKTLEDWSKESEANRLLLDRTKREWKSEEVRHFLAIDTEEGWQKIKKETFSKKSRPQIKRRNPLRYVAIVLPFFLAISLYLYKEHIQYTGERSETTSRIHTLPVLTLNNGEELILKGSAQQEEIRIEEKAKAYHTNRSLVYKSQDKPEKLQWNQLRIPQGTNYHLMLSDGTRIWLNANSTLKYPVTFPSTERRVQLSGEAYFEVAKNQEAPFYVETRGMNIKVLGTHFNVNTHYSEGVRTVLVEGSVALCRQDHKELTLHPGECADFHRISSEITVRNVDPGIYTAWRNGFFAFESEPLEEIVNMLGNWYGKEIIFHKPEHRKLRFSGHIKRYDDIETILRSITELTGIIFHCKGNTILVE